MSIVKYMGSVYNNICYFLEGKLPFNIGKYLLNIQSGFTQHCNCTTCAGFSKQPDLTCQFSCCNTSAENIITSEIDSKYGICSVI